jgi:hypothetical protein
VPAAVTDLSAARFEDEVFIRFTVPSANVEGPGPADLSRVEVYAITALHPPTAEQVRDERVRMRSALVATETVRRPLPPPLPAEPGRPAPPPLPVEPGLDQGAAALVREALSDAARVPVDATVPEVSEGAGPRAAAAAVGPLVGSADAFGPKRYYFVVGVSRSGRHGDPSPPAPVPLGSPSSAPREVELEYDEQSTVVRWSPPLDARVTPTDVLEPGMLASRPIVPPPPPTRYEVYEIPKSVESGGPAVLPAAVNAEPLTGTELRLAGVTFDVERCFAVRAVDTLEGIAVRGPRSEPACVTPVDTFPPAAPRSLQAVAGAGAISLIWEPGAERDLAGYIVLRGEAPGETLAPLTAAPIQETSFTDTSVQSGVRYVYAVVAVDSASPQNVSAQSNRAEETARD